VILCLVATIALIALLNLPKRQSEVPVKKQLLRIDFVGAILLVLTVTGLLYGLNRGRDVSWRSPLTISSLCATIPLSIAFVTIETRFAVERFTPGHIIFNRAPGTFINARLSYNVIHWICRRSCATRHDNNCLSHCNQWVSS